MAKSKPTLRVRNKGIRKVRVGELLEAAWNPADHPDSQAAALDAAVEELGFVGYPDVIELPDGSLMLSDGHLRKKVLLAKYGEDAEIEVAISDMTEDEAKLFAATKDPIAQLRQVNAERHAAIMASIDVRQDALKEMLAEIADRHMTPEPEPELSAEQLAEQKAGLEAFIAEKNKSLARGDDRHEVNFWVCLVFQSWHQKQEFLFAIKDVPVLYGMYADGQTLAERVGITVTPNQLGEMKSPLDKKLAALAVQEEVAAS